MKKTLAHYPDLVSQFHSELNGDLKPSEISFGSKKQVWWQCPSNPKHVYDMPPNYRTGKAKSGCPYCSGRRTLPEESLLATHYEIALEWDNEKNEHLTPSSLRYGSGKKVWWKCPKNHSYEARISDRTIHSSGCPYCSGKLVTPETSFAYLYPEIAAHWHPVKNGKLRPENVRSKSGKKVWFICPESNLHAYQARIADKTDSKKVGCPYCAGVQVAPDTSLEFKFPEISKEWHPTKNGKLTPDKVTSGSNKKIWWLCERGHEYQMQAFQRTHDNRGCNQCSKYGSSQETRIYCELKYQFPDVKFRHKISGFELDIFIPSIGIAVEYDGAFYHQSRYASDLSKNNAMRDAHIHLVRVREKPLDKISDLDVITPQRELRKTDLNALFHSFANLNSKVADVVSNYVACERFVNEEEYLIYMSYFPSPFPENSLAETHPKIAMQWDIEKNNPLTPYNFTHGSKHKAYWICENNHSHYVTINSKVTHFASNSQGCSYCSGRKTIKKKSLANRYPNLAKEWHPFRNAPLTPEDVSPSSDRIVWWQCNVHPKMEWEGRIRTRVRGYERCQICSPSSKMKYVTQIKQLLMQGFNEEETAEKLGMSIAMVNRLK